MAKLTIKSPGFESRVIDLKLGVNHLGRAANNDFQIDHPTISGRHCEIELGEGELVLRDCGSTNGTFVGGRKIKEARVREGQTISLGEVALLVESTGVTVEIPRFQLPDERPKPPVVLADGGMVCPRHPQARATHQCIHCLEVLCEECAHQIRRKGGKLLRLCPKCGYPCAPLGAPKARKRSLLGFVRKTVKLPFLGGSKTKSDQ